MTLAENHSLTDSLQMTQMLDMNDRYRTDHDRRIFSSLPIPPWLDAAGGSEVLDPDPRFIAPSLFSHNLRVDPRIHNILRSQDLADRIMEQYCTYISELFFPTSYHNSSRKTLSERGILLLP